MHYSTTTTSVPSSWIYQPHNQYCQL